MKRKAKKIVVIGDLIMDVRHEGKYLGVSASDGKTPVGTDVSTESTWGGAGLLVKNIVALGSNVTFVSLVGNDDYGMVAERVADPRLKKIFFRVPGRPTVRKEQFWIKKRKVLTWYRSDLSPLPESTERKILRTLGDEIRSAEKIVVTDYRRGLLSHRLVNRIKKIVTRANVPLYVDSQVAYREGNHRWYQGANLFCLNKKEAQSVDKVFDERMLAHSLRRIQKILRAKNIIVKLGGRGSAAMLGNDYIETAALRGKIMDTTGSGDAFLARLAVGGGPLNAEDLRAANIWAGLSARMKGTELPSLAMFKKLVIKQKKR